MMDTATAATVGIHTIMIANDFPSTQTRCSSDLAEGRQILPDGAFGHGAQPSRLEDPSRVCCHGTGQLAVLLMGETHTGTRIIMGTPE